MDISFPGSVAIASIASYLPRRSQGAILCSCFYRDFLFHRYLILAQFVIIGFIYISTEMAEGFDRYSDALNQVQRTALDPTPLTSNNNTDNNNNNTTTENSPHKNSSSVFSHEAGYDSLVTGYSFIKLANYLGS